MSLALSWVIESMLMMLAADVKVLVEVEERPRHRRLLSTAAVAPRAQALRRVSVKPATSAARAATTGAAPDIRGSGISVRASPARRRDGRGAAAQSDGGGHPPRHPSFWAAQPDDLTTGSSGGRRRRHPRGLTGDIGSPPRGALAQHAISCRSYACGLAGAFSPELPSPLRARSLKPVIGGFEVLLALPSA